MVNIHVSLKASTVKLNVDTYIGKKIKKTRMRTFQTPDGPDSELRSP